MFGRPKKITYGNFEVLRYCADCGYQGRWSDFIVMQTTCGYPCHNCGSSRIMPTRVMRPVFEGFFKKFTGWEDRDGRRFPANIKFKSIQGLP